MAQVAKVAFSDYLQNTAMALDLIQTVDKLPDTGLIILKPNLTNADSPPVTTPVEIVEAVYHYCRELCNADIAIGEGCGSGKTINAFQRNGYRDLARKYNIELIDFNECETDKVKNPSCHTLKEFYIPKIARDAFIISIPVLKDHSFTVTTISMKNMFGIAPASHYKGSWNKSKLHHPSTHKSVVDLCCYKKPDLCVVDAVTALQGMHLSGIPLHLNTILASFNPVAVDAIGSEMLGHDPRKIEYLQLANGRLGSMDNIEIVNSHPQPC
ncbi:DUF362 domain-containing protein [Planctomycetota bacterium]